MRSKWLASITGAFGDGAILFPLLAILSFNCGFSGAALLLSAGVAYWVSGVVFRVPMSVQPLKSIAIAAVALGASSVEVRVSTALLGFLCLCLAFIDVDKISEKVPLSLVHGLQLGLGIVLCLQGLNTSSVPVWPVWIVALAMLMVISDVAFSLPVLGFVATGGIVWAVFTASGATGSDSAAGAPSLLRAGVVASLVAPQMALTLGNSVLGTRDVALRYFGDGARKVTVGNLLRSIGLGNIVSAIVGGLPFCHGSGGVTAHVRGGSRHWASNAIIGTFLLIVGLVYAVNGSFKLNFPSAIMASLLVAVGFFHMMLARPSARDTLGKLKLACMGVAAVTTSNMLVVLCAGILVELLVFVAQRAAGRNFSTRRRATL